jgi:putative ABC transport system ATP-binding protein
MENVISTRGITKDYHVGDVVVHALRGIDLDVRRGELLAIMGASGSGKSTLMNVLGCLDRPTTGEYSLGGTDVSRLTGDEYADIRNQRIGFVFQSYNLLPRTSALENVELPLFYDHAARIEDPKGSAVRALERVGLGGRLHHEPTQLSGGEQQRVAIARALVNRPSLILADEPTGNLDSRTSTDVMALFQDLNDQGITILLVTHEPDVAQYAKRIIVMRDGLIVSDRPVWDRRNAVRDATRMQPRDGAAVGGREQSAAEEAVR